MAQLPREAAVRPAAEGGGGARGDEHRAADQLGFVEGEGVRWDGKHAGNRTFGAIDDRD